MLKLDIFSQISEGDGLDSVVDFKIDVPVESSFTQSLLSPLRTTDMQDNLHIPSAQYMDINEGFHRHIFEFY